MSEKNSNFTYERNWNSLLRTICGTTLLATPALFTYLIFKKSPLTTIKKAEYSLRTSFIGSAVFFSSRELLFGEQIYLISKIDELDGKKFSIYPVQYTAIPGLFTGLILGLPSLSLHKCLLTSITFGAATSGIHLFNNILKSTSPISLTETNKTGDTSKSKEFSWRNKIPEWSPIRVYSKEEYDLRNQRILELKQLEKEIEEMKIKIRTLKRVKEIVESEKKDEP